MQENYVNFRIRHETILRTINIQQGVYIQIKDLRQKIKEQLKILNSNENFNEEIQIFDDKEQYPLCLADRVRNSQTVVVVRSPNTNQSSTCRSCFLGRSNFSTPCCQQPICQQCDQKFIQFGKCFYNMNTQCQFKYVNYQHQPLKIQNEISPQELEIAIKNAVFFIVKSNNETNVNLAKQYNCWATTRKNFSILQSEFSRNKVILIFTANRVDKFLGCARMVNQYVQKDPKWSWSSTQSIQLAENFQIEWFRKGHVDFSVLQDTINPKTGDYVVKSRDCQEVPADIGQRICLFFQQIKMTEQETQIQEVVEPVKDDWDFEKILDCNYFVDKKNQENVPPPIQAISPPKSSSSSSPSPSPVKPKQDTQQMMEMAIFKQLCEPLIATQNMEASWSQMNKGKIPGLTGKVQYPHPILQKMAHGSAKHAESMLLKFAQFKNAYQEQTKRSESNDKKKSKRDRSSSPDERRRSSMIIQKIFNLKGKKSKDRKDKKSKHKKRSHSRHKKSKKQKH